MLDKPVGHVFPSSDVMPLSPRQRLHLILLGVENVSKSTAFYEALGWKKSPTSNEGFVKFDLGGYALSLISRNDFAKDALYETAKGSGFSGVGLIYLAQSADEVPRILAKAVEAGGAIVKPATRTHWGIAGYFTDPDGHLFEVDFEEAWVFDSDHRLVVDQMNNPAG
jgi:predicted lactoylglutathione lyase